MFSGKKITAICENCGQGNVLNLEHFAGAGAEKVFENHVITVCQNCKKDILVELYEAYIH